MSIEFQITPGSATPIYQQVVDQVRLAVAAGELKTGDPLPSVRTLAEQLVLNPNTVARAFGELVRDGVIESRHGQGVFVATKRRVFADDERDRRMSLALDGLLSEAAALDFSAAEVRAAVDRRLKEVGLRKR